MRRVPANVAHLDGREVVKAGLGTAIFEEAAKQAAEIDRDLEEWWGALLDGQLGRDAWERYTAAGRIVRSMGFEPLTVDQILERGETELVPRLLALAGREEQLFLVEAVLGLLQPPQDMLGGAFDLYMRLKAGDLEGYSPSQLRRHRQSKERAADYLIEVIGDKPLRDVTRADALRFRDWWVAKVARENLTRDAANRSFADIQGMLTAIDAALQTTYRAVWGGLRLKQARRTQKRRPAFSIDFVQRKILQPGALDSIRFDVRMAFYMQIETGARPSEICNLKPEAIRARDAIPHIAIEETDERILKSGNATRIIPLVGVSLWAARQVPEGFPLLRNNEDSFSAAMGKGLTRLKLRPTPQHSPYSIRHTFQDRLLASGAGDRIQTDLMGHEFERVKYGEGPTLKQKQQLLEKIKFRWIAELAAPQVDHGMKDTPRKIRQPYR